MAGLNFRYSALTLPLDDITGPTRFAEATLILRVDVLISTWRAEHPILDAPSPLEG